MSAHDNREAKLKRVKQTDVQKKMVSGSKGKHAHRESEISITPPKAAQTLESRFSVESSHKVKQPHNGRQTVHSASCCQMRTVVFQSL